MFTKDARWVIWEGNSECFHERVECAVRRDDTSPAADFWKQMSAGEWEADPYFQGAPDDEQIHDVAQIFAKIEYVGVHGEPSNRTAVNNLDKGVWEFKHGWHRLAYFDTPGDGSFEPKERVDDRRVCDPDCEDDYWWYPIMDSVLRLTNGWSKEGQMAPPEAVDLALAIREEDVKHDGC